MEPNKVEVNVGMAEALNNIANILKTGMFQGMHAGPVAAAITWCENGASFYGVKAPTPENQPQPEAAKPDLKAVPDESVPEAQG
jgi:hypothetical protein